MMFNTNLSSTIRQSKAHANARIVYRNVRTAAKERGLGPVTLARASRVPVARTVNMWLGLGANMSELCRFASATGLSVEGMFTGTRGAAL